MNFNLLYLIISISRSILSLMWYFIVFLLYSYYILIIFWHILAYFVNMIILNLPWSGEIIGLINLDELVELLQVRKKRTAKHIKNLSNEKNNKKKKIKNNKEKNRNKKIYKLSLYVRQKLGDGIIFGITPYTHINGHEWYTIALPQAPKLERCTTCAFPVVIQQTPNFKFTVGDWLFYQIG